MGNSPPPKGSQAKGDARARRGTGQNSGDGRASVKRNSREADAACPEIDHASPQKRARKAVPPGDVVDGEKGCTYVHEKEATPLPPRPVKGAMGELGTVGPETSELRYLLILLKYTLSTCRERMFHCTRFMDHIQKSRACFKAEAVDGPPALCSEEYALGLLLHMTVSDLDKFLASCPGDAKRKFYATVHQLARTLLQFSEKLLTLSCPEFEMLISMRMLFYTCEHELYSTIASYATSLSTTDPFNQHLQKIVKYNLINILA